MGNFIKEDIETMWGFVEDAIHLGRNRTLAEEVRCLVSVVVQKQKAARGPMATLSESLENTKKLLQRAVEPAAEAVKAKTFYVEWGRETEAADQTRETSTAAAVSAEEAREGAVDSNEVDPQGSQEDLIATKELVAREAQPNVAAESVVQEKGPNAERIGAAIELCDWLDRVRENDRIAPERVVSITKQKSGSLLAALGVERIEQVGAFDQQCQQIVDSVATDLLERDLQVCETVECGYRVKDQIIRPQLVMVYRLGSGKTTSLEN